MQKELDKPTLRDVLQDDRPGPSKIVEVTEDYGRQEMFQTEGDGRALRLDPGFKKDSKRRYRNN